jgi:hypothetical protein
MKQDVAVWRLDQVRGGWTRVSRQRRARPGEVLVVEAKDGGYDVEVGLDPGVKALVPSCPELARQVDPAMGAEDAYRDDSASVAQQRWVSLEQHSADAREQAKALVEVLAPRIPNTACDSAVAAAYAHDVGKSHKIWQDALCELAPAELRAEIDDGRPWAKSGQAGRLNFVRGVPLGGNQANAFALRQRVDQAPWCGLGIRTVQSAPQPRQHDPRLARSGRRLDHGPLDSGGHHRIPVASRRRPPSPETTRLASKTPAVSSSSSAARWNSARRSSVITSVTELLTPLRLPRNGSAPAESEPGNSQGHPGQIATGQVGSAATSAATLGPAGRDST